MANERSYSGWKLDTLDIRDILFKPSIDPANLPEKVDLKENVRTIYDQLNTNSCTANAIAAAFEFILLKHNARKVFSPSRLFIYYNEREMRNETDLVKAIGNVAKSIGMTKIAKNAGLSRPSLYKALSDGSKPQFATIMKVLKAVGGQVKINPITA